VLFEEKAPDAIDLGPTSIDISTAVWEFSLVYEVAVLATLPEYRGYPFSNSYYFARSRPVPRSVQLRVVRMSLESPFWLAALVPLKVAAAGIVWPLAKAFEWVYTIDVRIPADRAEWSARQAEAEARTAEAHLRSARANTELQRLRERTAQQPLRPIEVTIGSADAFTIPGRMHTP
jgi:hypothetical protein